MTSNQKFATTEDLKDILLYLEHKRSRCYLMKPLKIDEDEDWEDEDFEEEEWDEEDEEDEE